MVDRTTVALFVMLAFASVGCEATPRPPDVHPNRVPASAPAEENPAERPELPAPDFTPAELRRIARLSPLGPPPADPTNRVADDPRARALGKELFFDARLSGSGTVSCASCHDPIRDFTDGRALPSTLGEGTRNTPALWNLAWEKSFFWDGRASTLWGQAWVPIEHPREMAGDRLQVLHRIAGDRALCSEFEALFGVWPSLDRFPARATVAPASDLREPLPAAIGTAAEFTPEWNALSSDDRDLIDALATQVGKVLAAYQRTLVSGETSFDRAAPLLATGDTAADYPEAARRGLKLFIGKARCHLCHSGPTFSDHAFHATGVAPRPGLPEDQGRFGARARIEADPFGANGPHSDAPEGDAAFRAGAGVITGSDFGAFRTPGLRNVARTAPYMHAGQFATLEEVLRFYSDRVGSIPADPAHPEPLNEPLRLTRAEIADLIAFLESLSDEMIPAIPRSDPSERR